MNAKVSAVLSLVGVGAVSFVGVSLGGDAALMMRSYMATDDVTEDWTPSRAIPPAQTPSSSSQEHNRSTKNKLSDS